MRPLASSDSGTIKAPGGTGITSFLGRVGSAVVRIEPQENLLCLQRRYLENVGQCRDSCLPEAAANSLACFAACCATSNASSAIVPSPYRSGSVSEDYKLSHEIMFRN